MNDKTKQTEQKLKGAYYTPKEIVDFFINWAIDKNIKQNILEPSAGDGNFINNIKNLHKDSSLVAVEIDENEALKIKPSLENNQYVVLVDDFYNFYERYKNKEKEFDVIIGNPPYIRYQFLTEEQRAYQSDILINNGLKSNKLINAWVAFTVACLELLKENGKIAFVLPTDILQVSYAKELREFLFKSLKEINIINFENIVFTETQQDVILLMGIKKDNENQSTKLKILNLKDLSELPKDLEGYSYKSYKDYQSDKWIKFKLNNNDRNFYDTDFQNKTISLNELAKTEVGITTGNNKFFVINDELLKSYNLEEYKKPLLGRSIETDGLFYTAKDLETNIEKQNNVWLLDFNKKELSQGALNYLNYGIENKQNKGYKLGIRDKWYEVPSIWIPDVFLLRRIGKYPKIVKNEINGVSTDTFHRMKVLNNTNIYKLLVLFYSSVTLLSFELEGRIFGGGALELIPGDFKNIRIPKVTDDLNFKELADEIDNKLRSQIDIEEIVEWVDNKILIYSNFTVSELKTIHSLWKELNKKRIS